MIPLRRAGLAGLLVLAGCVAAPQQVVTPPPVTRAVEPPARLAFSFEGALVQGGVVIGTAPSGTRALSMDGTEVPLAPDGRFMIGFDRDAGSTARLVATLDDGRSVVETLVVRPREWDIQRIDLPLRGSTPSATFERIRAPEVAQIVAARTVRSAVDGWRQRFAWPVTGRISSVFGSQRIFRGEPAAYHNGVDVVRPTGTPITAPADGVVVLATAKPFTLEGNLLIVDHGMGLNSAFLHLSRIDVRQGDRIRRGQTIGAIGTTGRSTGAHLHWGMMWNGARIDPALLAGPMP